MTQEERELLLKDLCARLPYRVICRKDCKTVDGEDFYLDEYPNSIELAKYLTIDDMVITIKPYLRPMSSMTEEEWEELKFWKSKLVECNESDDEKFYGIINTIHQLYYSHHIDMHNLIPTGLALEAPEGMYDCGSGDIGGNDNGGGMGE